ncbi:hypothetical protein LTR37_005405 [Vermiconidia calcicola]|uniref:Uncharacterized protein n=1 Tax=Vermiconidia calcicola TaxID=1690605 RepID=A0ACC3NKU2_9PEZI|nr:hypothetical protein LTR37_005405 [Vermiconidia calcicola]
MAASVRVLDTVELLEHILYKLPMRDLLLAQRVCKQWQAVIKDSKKLQRALFFEPLDGSPLLAVTEENGHGTRWFRRNDNLKCAPWVQTAPSGSIRAPVGNPLLQTLFHIIDTDVKVTLQTRCRSDIERRFPTPWKYEHASWRKMLLSQPTTTTICTMTGETEQNEHIEYVRCTGEDSMGTILSQILEHWDGEKLRPSSGEQRYYTYRVVKLGGLDYLSRFYPVASNEDLDDIAAALSSRPMPEC